MLEKLLELRTKLILGSILFGVAFYTIEAFAFGGWPFHIPDMEGGVEVTIENTRHNEEKLKAMEEEREREQYEKKNKSELKNILEEERRQKEVDIWKQCKETGRV